MQLNPEGNNVYGVIIYPQLDNKLITFIAESLAINFKDISLNTSNFNGQSSLSYNQNNIEFLVEQGLEKNEWLFNARFTGESHAIITDLTALFTHFSSSKIKATFELYDDEIPPNLIFDIS